MASEKDAQTIARDTAAKGRNVAEDTTRRMAETAAEATQRGADTASDMMGKATQVAGQVAGQTTDQLNRMMGLSAEAQGEVAQQARENMDVMTQCGSVLMDGMQSIMREWMGFAQEAMARNAEGVNAMMRSRSVQDLYAAQSSMVKDEMELLLNRSVKISELSAKTANDAVRRLNARAEGAARHARRSA
ncbi:phasin family protein [Azospirillum sp. OGB3]|uniref:phasin family protein n=1 Tax=Azospirillum sp. OGB3 TaxID=2587012 RepID=UPI001605C8BD|nr:phasin family protein [Azospirillum sp. OGB3]MBB3265306.1 phasin family protein [Azospirillum sp. OGB3]